MVDLTGKTREELLALAELYSSNAYVDEQVRKIAEETNQQVIAIGQVKDSIAELSRQMKLLRQKLDAS